MSDLLRDGSLGSTDTAAVAVSISTDWATWGWLVESPQLDFMFHSIHYLDSLRFLFGEPQRVTAFARRAPGQVAAGESITATVLEFASTLVTVTVNHNNPFPSHHQAELRLIGSEAAVYGEIGLLYDYPHGRDDRLRVTSASRAVERDDILTGSWISAAFSGPMDGLLRAIDEGGEPPTTGGADNLGTLRVVLAAYRSAELSTAVDPRAVR